MPFPTTRVIPAGWSEHHAAVARGAMTAQVTVGVQTGTTYDPETDDTTATWSNDYTGPARIQALNDSRLSEQAAQTIAGRAYLVQLDYTGSFDADVVPGARCHVIAAPNDPMLAGQDLWVVDVQMGSERFTRDIVCSDNQTDAPASP